MYNLGIRYRYGIGVRRDWGQAYELFAKSAETGFVSAMVELGDALTQRARRPQSAPRRRMAAARRRCRLDARQVPARDDLLFRPATARRHRRPCSRTSRWRCCGSAAWRETGDSDAQVVPRAASCRAATALTSPQPEIAGALLAARGLWRQRLRAGEFRRTAAPRLRAGEAGIRLARGDRAARARAQPGLGAGRARAGADQARSASSVRSKSPGRGDEARLPRDRARGAIDAVPRPASRSPKWRPRICSPRWRRTARRSMRRAGRC